MMKRKLLSLFLATLMVFSSVLPVFATEGEPTPTPPTDTDEPIVTLTYDDLYVGDAVFAWDAFDKTAEDTLDFGGGTSIVLAGEEGGLQLVLTVASTAVAKYGNGYLELTDASAKWDDTLKIAGVYNLPVYQSALEVNTYSTQMVMSLLEVTEAYAPHNPGAQDAIPFASGNKTTFTTFGITESMSFIAGANVTLYDALSENYLKASSGDDAAKAKFRTPIDYNTYKFITEGHPTDKTKSAVAQTYAEHVFAVDATDEDTTNDPGFTTYVTGYEADWTVFSEYLTKSSSSTIKEKYWNYSTNKELGYFAAHYSADFYSKNTSNTPELFNSGVAKTTVTTSAWALDAEWKTNGKIWSTKDYEAVTTQTRVNTVTALDKNSDNKDQYKSSASFYVDGVAPKAATNSSTYWKDYEKTGTVVPSADFLVRPQGMNARYYAIRIYNEALTEDQIKQNHFADLCKFYGLDLALIANLQANDLLSAVIDAFAEYELGAEGIDKEMLDAKLGEYKLPEQNAGDYADLYVTEDLLYRWDAYNNIVVGEDGVAVLTDKNGGEIALSLGNATYNGAKQYVMTEDAFDFSALIERDGAGVYANADLEFELVLTQLSFADNGLTGSQLRYPYPNIQLGPIGGNTPSGGSKYYGTSYGGMGHFYVGMTDGTTTATKAYTFGSETVTITYLSTTAKQIATEDWCTPRYFGNYLGQSYSVGGAINFKLAEGASSGTMDVQLYRDGMKVLNSSGTPVATTGIYYEPGKLATGKVADPATKEEADAAFLKTPYENTLLGADEGIFKLAGNRVNGAKMVYGYHAFRVYKKTLSEAERMQNHFADLATYHRIENLDEYNALSAETKLALWAQFFAVSLNAVATDESSNTSFEDVTKEELDAAILAMADYEAKQEALKIYNDMYVQGGSFLWNAYHEADKVITGTESLGSSASGANLTVSVGTSGSAAFQDGYLRLVNSTLAVSGAYVRPSNETLNYTTELVYASYLDESIERAGNTSFRPGYMKDGEFIEQSNYPAFSPAQTQNAFVTLGFKEHIRFADKQDIEWLQAWNGAYAAANANEALRATFWTPISEYDYNTYNPNGDNANFRKVGGDSGNDPIGAYSQTGYEANWDGFAQVVAARSSFYVGYNYGLTNIEGRYNSYILKTDIYGNAGGWYAQYDVLNSFGAQGNWSSADFGEISTHTWFETITDEGGKAASKLTIGTQHGKLTYSPAGLTGGTTANLSTDFKADMFNADYYAIRVYPFALTDEMRAQNHFADLCGYTKIDEEIAALYHELSEKGQQALHAQFASMTLNDADKDALEEAIETNVAAEKAFAELGAVAEDFFAFKGYQVHLYGDPAFRATFSLEDFDNAEVTLKEIKMALAFEGGTSFEATYIGNAITDASLGLYTDETDDEVSIGLVFASAAEQTKDFLTKDWTVTATVTITYRGIDFTMECDMTSEAFGPAVSVYELATHEAFKDFDTSKAVCAIVEAE